MNGSGTHHIFRLGARLGVVMFLVRRKRAREGAGEAAGAPDLGAGDRRVYHEDGHRDIMRIMSGQRPKLLCVLAEPGVGASHTVRRAAGELGLQPLCLHSERERQKAASWKAVWVDSTQSLPIIDPCTASTPAERRDIMELQRKCNRTLCVIVNDEGIASHLGSAKGGALVRMGRQERGLIMKKVAALAAGSPGGHGFPSPDAFRRAVVSCADACGGNLTYAMSQMQMLQRMARRGELREAVPLRRHTTVPDQGGFVARRASGVWEARVRAARGQPHEGVTMLQSAPGKRWATFGHRPACAYSDALAEASGFRATHTKTRAPRRAQGPSLSLEQEWREAEWRSSIAALEWALPRREIDVLRARDPGVHGDGEYDDT